MGRRVVSRDEADRIRKDLEEQGKRNVLILPGPRDGRVELRWEDSPAELRKAQEISLAQRGFLKLGVISVGLILVLLIVLAIVA